MARLHRRLLRVLIDDIVRGRIPEGSMLPTEVELARELAVGRGAVREALQGLAERRLIVVRRGRGSTVLPRGEWNVLDADVLTGLLASPASTEVLGEILECRRMLEIEAAGLAAERATANHLMQLADALARMSSMAQRAPENAAAEEAFHEADVEFHDAIVHASGNRVVARVTEPIQHALRIARGPIAHPYERMQRGIPEHKRILAAISNRDADAARAAMRAHLATVDEYLAQYGSQQPAEGRLP